MKLNKFREKLIKNIDLALRGEVDDDMQFSELWSHVRDHVDGVADDEDINDDEGEDDEVAEEEIEDEA